MAPIAKTLNCFPTSAPFTCAPFHRFPFLHKVGAWNRSIAIPETLVEVLSLFRLDEPHVPSAPRRVMASGGRTLITSRSVPTAKFPISSTTLTSSWNTRGRQACPVVHVCGGARQERHIVVTGDQGQVEATVPGTEVFSAIVLPHHRYPAP